MSEHAMFFQELKLTFQEFSYLLEKLFNYANRRKDQIVGKWAENHYYRKIKHMILRKKYLNVLNISKNWFLSGFAYFNLLGSKYSFNITRWIKLLLKDLSWFAFLIYDSQTLCLGWETYILIKSRKPINQHGFRA